MAYTDVVQLACILVGLGVAIPFAVTRVGGWETVAERYVAQMPSFPTGTAVWVWVDMALLLMLGGIPWQVYFQRVLACPDARTSVRLSWIAGICCLLMAMPAVMIGAVGAVADWSQTSAGEPPRTAMVLPYVLQYWTPPAVAVIGLGAVAAAVMSSVDSSILSASSLFVCNVYRPLIRPTADDRQSRRVLRGSIVVIGMVATCLALSVQSVYALWYLCADFVYVILFPQFVMVLYSSMANRIGAAAGLAVSLLLRLGGGEPMLGLPAWIPYPLEEGGESHFPVRTFAMLSGLSTIWLVSRFTRNIDPPRPLTVPDSADSV